MNSLLTFRRKGSLPARENIFSPMLLFAIIAPAMSMAIVKSETPMYENTARLPESGTLNMNNAANDNSTITSSMRSQTMEGRLLDTGIPVRAFRISAFAGSPILPGVKLLSVMPKSWTGTRIKNGALTRNFHFRTRNAIETTETQSAAAMYLLSAVASRRASSAGFEVHTIHASRATLMAAAASLNFDMIKLSQPSFKNLLRLQSSGFKYQKPRFISRYLGF